MKKSFLCLFLALLMVFTALPMYADAADSSVGAGLDLPVREATDEGLAATGQTSSSTSRSIPTILLPLRGTISPARRPMAYGF